MMMKEYESLVGRRLQHNITDDRGVLLISAGTVLLQAHIDKLKKFKINIIEVETALEKEEQEDSPLPANDPVRPVVQFAPTAARELINRTEAYLQEIDNMIQQEGVVPVAELEEKLIPVIMDTAKSRGLFRLFSELKEKEDFRYKQSMGVAFIATKLGKQLQLSKEELILLTAAASLYDIGSTKLPSHLVYKPGRFDIHEYEIMKQHTVWGYELLKKSEVDPRIAIVALQHHEREDGSGYPNGLRGDQIDPFSKIVALADVYMAMMSERPYRDALSFYDVIQEIHQEIIKGRFDSRAGLVLLESLMTSQLGCEVILSDNRQGKIVLINPNYPASPLIALNDQEFLDLSKTNEITIKEVIG